MTLKVGVTGGIGSGKSLVCSLFECLGVPVYYADDRARQLMHHDPGLKAKITLQFGNVYAPDGALDRKKLAGLVFNDREKLKLLNKLVHPVVLKDTSDWFERQQTPYAIKEAALIFESGGNELLDRVISVSAPRKLRLKRVHRRDGMPYREIIKRMNEQWPQREKDKLSDFVIRNNEKSSVIIQVWNIHKHLLAISSDKIQSV